LQNPSQVDEYRVKSLSAPAWRGDLTTAFEHWLCASLRVGMSLTVGGLPGEEEKRGMHHFHKLEKEMLAAGYG